MQYLPSKKFLVVVLVVLIVLGLGFLVSYKSNSNNDNNSSGKFSYISSLFKGNEKDSDNDGLKDWEETLWKTDPKNPDSDGDGTLDGEEVNLGRDPLKPGPDDFYSKNYSFSADKTNNNSTEQLSATEKISRDFLANYLLIKQMDSGKVDEKTKENLVNSLLANIDGEISGRVYTVADIKISQDNSKEAIKNYGNKIGGVLIKDRGPYSPGSELLIFKTALETDNYDKFNNLEKNINVYSDLITELIDIYTPLNLSKNHLSIINNLSRLREVVINMKNFPKDPIKSLVSLKQHFNFLSGLMNSLAFLKNYFMDNGIYFNSSDPGYILQKLK